MYQPEHLKTKELITIKPSRELNFLPINKRYVSTLNIHNKTDHHIIFRVKTTAARSYVVNPHTDIILPKRDTEVKFTMPFIDKVKERSEDKFLVQAILYDNKDISLDQEGLYNAFVELSKKVSPKDIQSFKLKVHFEMYTTIEEETSAQATPLKTPFFPFFESKGEELSELNIDGMEKEMDGEKAKTRKKFDFRAQTLGPKSIFSRDERKSETLSLREIGNMNVNSNTEPKRRLVFKVKKNSTLIPDLLSKSPRIVQENLTPERVSKDLFNNFEMAAGHSQDGLSPFTSPHRSFVENNNSRFDMSTKSDINGDRSPMDDAKRTLIYKSKYEALKDKWQSQQNQLAKLKEERNEYLEEMNKARVMIGTETEIGGGESLKKVEEKKRPIEIWQMLMISVIFLILGSLFKGK